MIHHLAPRVEGGADSREHGPELLVGIIVGVALRIVPLPRQVDHLKCAHTDRFESQLADRIAGHLQLGSPPR